MEESPVTNDMCLQGKNPDIYKQFPQFQNVDYDKQCP